MEDEEMEKAMGLHWEILGTWGTFSMFAMDGMGCAIFRHGCCCFHDLQASKLVKSFGP